MKALRFITWKLGTWLQDILDRPDQHFLGPIFLYGYVWAAVFFLGVLKVLEAGDHLEAWGKRIVQEYRSFK